MTSGTAAQGIQALRRWSDMPVHLPRITLADAQSEPHDQRLFQDDAPARKDVAMPIQVYVAEDSRGGYCIYSVLTHAMLDVRAFPVRWMAVSEARRRGWVVIE